MNNKKEIINNLLSFAVIDVLNLLIPIITMPLLTRALGSSSYGDYMLLITILTFGHTIIDYGVQFTGVRDLSRNRNNQFICSSIYLENQAIRFIFLFLYTIITIIFLMLSNKIELLYYFIYGGVFYLVGYLLASPWFFQGMGKTKILMIVTFIFKLFTLIGIIFFVKNKEDIYIAIFLSTWTMFISGSILFFILRKKIIFKKFSLTDLTLRLKNSFNVFIGILAPNLYNSVPTIFLGTIAKPSYFAFYVVAARLCDIIVVIQNIISKSIYPVISRSEKNHIKVILLINISLAIPIIIFISLFGSDLLSLFLGNEYANSQIYLLIFSFGLLFIGIANSFSQGFFLPKNYDAIYRKVSLRVSALSAIICYLLIARYNLIGGAIGITMARVLFSLDYAITYFSMKKN
ncbi:oligosaccharide flippase family protein [Proteus hauseri]|nr:oligosaccharide flippase family protein [Proteus hauseri]MBG6031074.1 oligosaccharide flippase family protein [Proteus hauseri]